MEEEKPEIIKEEIKEKPKFSFKEYYDKNPKFRKQHLQKCSEKVECTCGKMVIRYNLSKHKKTKIHNKILNGEVDKVDKFDKLFNEIEIIKKLIKALKK